jgi:hypothetical protein
MLCEGELLLELSSCGASFGEELVFGEVCIVIKGQVASYGA